MCKFFLKFILIFFFFQILKAEEIYGFPRIIDGDTVHINSKKIRLEGIDAPEIKQQCQKVFLKISTVIGFNFKKDYSCGVISKKKLIDKINKTQIKCISSGRDRYKRYLATCFKNEINLNKWMVRNGYAVAYRKYSKDYIKDENYAEENKRGLWAGNFIYPEKWRKLK
jgi:endonuclease YncB( thermonuclease family)